MVSLCADSQYVSRPFSTSSAHIFPDLLALYVCVCVRVVLAQLHKLMIFHVHQSPFRHAPSSFRRNGMMFIIGRVKSKSEKKKTKTRKEYVLTWVIWSMRVVRRRVQWQRLALVRQCQQPWFVPIPFWHALCSVQTAVQTRHSDSTPLNIRVEKIGRVATCCADASVCRIKTDAAAHPWIRFCLISN